MTPRTIDASALPREAFGHRSLPWWGTLGFIVIEGTTLAVGVASYLYLRRNFEQWPPPATPLPDLLLPAIVLALLLVKVLPMRAAAEAADRLDTGGIIRNLGIAVTIGAVVLGLRIFEFQALNVRWDHSAYGSLLWFILGLHTVLLLTDLLESFVMTLIFWRGRQEPKHFTDVEDAAFYEYFLSAASVPVYVVVFLGARLL
jgi:cytochrome c oxidase subunit III